MASLFEKGFNKFADMGNALNKEANKLVGKEVFGEIKKIEEPKVFPPFESYPPCTVEEPEQWTALTGNSNRTYGNGTTESTTNTISSNSTATDKNTVKLEKRTSILHYWHNNWRNK